MSMNDELTHLMTGHPDPDARIRAAYELGFRAGRRDPLPEDLARIVRSIARAFGCTPEQAALTLGLTRAKRKTVLKIVANRPAPQQQRKMRK